VVSHPKRCNMKVSSSRTKKDGSAEDAGFLADRIGPDVADEQIRQGDMWNERYPASGENRPIEPKGPRLKGPGILKWILFLLIIGYAVISYYRIPMLSALGDYLILDHPLKRADLIVCTPGPPLEQSLTAAELYQRGLAPRIFIPQEPPPAGLDILREQGGRYPEASDLFMETLKHLNVPESACTVGNRAVDSVWEEAEELREWVLRKEIRSMIIVTPPYSARRTYRLFKNILDGKEVEIMISPSRYSGFQADTWWKRDRYVSDVIMEYLKLIYYGIRGLW
jgi:uncharacterized SAM-binding protein YcdF (DUF218 family)